MVGYWQSLDFGDLVADVSGPRTDQGCLPPSNTTQLPSVDGTRACPLLVQKATNLCAAGLVAKCQKALVRNEKRPPTEAA